MKRLGYLISIAILMALLQGCVQNTDVDNRVTPTKSFSSAPSVTATVIPVDPQKRSDFFAKSGFKTENMENKAVLVDQNTLALSLTGSSSCPPTPETITVLDDTLNILLKSYPDECTADLTTSYWEIILPPVMTPRASDLNVDVITSQGIKIRLIALVPK